MTTVPALLAHTRGLVCRGPHRCYYCGAPCAGEYVAAEWVKDSFTARDTIVGGDWVCVGCTLALDERATLTLPDGTVRVGQKTRCYSHVISAERAVAATKAHRAWLLDQCLAPPEPPFAIVLSDSGQKHLLYRGVVCRDRERFALTLEGERIDYAPDELRARLAVAMKICAATGKPALAEPLSHSAAMRVVAMHGDESLVRDWNHEEGLSLLAAWLCPTKEECRA